ncbi:MAG: hypothetical protein ACRDZO_11215 [Egibacteraceae bacterium]
MTDGGRDLLHFHRRYHHAGHYTGYAVDLGARLAAHRAGRGARLVEVITAAGIGFDLARVWPDADRGKERRLKRSSGASRYCPSARPTRPHRNRNRRPSPTRSCRGPRPLPAADRHDPAEPGAATCLSRPAG